MASRLASFTPRRMAAALVWMSAALALFAQLLHLSRWEVPLLILALPISWAAADATTGLVHWGLDRYGSPQTPLLGGIIRDFRDHHDRPRDFLRGDFLETTANSALAAAPVMLASMLVGLPPWLGVAVLVWILGCVVTNYIHLLAHHPDPPRVVRLLQALQLILHPAEHARHHTGDHRAGYCITVGWMNPVFERLRLFERLERMLPPTANEGLRPPSTSTSPRLRR